MKSKWFIIIIYLLLLNIMNNFVFAQNKYKTIDKIIDKIVSENIHPDEYMLSNDYKSKRELIREELLAKLTQMVEEDRYEKLLHILFFIVDISDERYIPLLAKIEQRIDSPAGVNIVGYSKFIELKISNVTGETMIKMIANPDIGPYLFGDIASYVFSKVENFDDKLNKFKILTERTNFKYKHVVRGLLKELCYEDPNKTDIFINSDKAFKKNLRYDCASINEAP